MPEPFKNFINPESIARLGTCLKAAGPFDADAFQSACVHQLEDRELKDRVRHVAGVLREMLPSAYPAALDHVLASLPVDDTSDRGAMHWWCFAQFIEEFGLQHPEESLDAMTRLTSWFSCEFAVRPILAADPENVMRRMRGWTSSGDEHVRRLASEGSRPLLPWGMRLQVFREDPEPVLNLLELLRDDASEYVRRSVANNLNDIAKDHPERVIAVCRAWLQEASDERTRLVRHALRTLFKKGHPQALALFGFGPPRVEAALRVTPDSLQVGESLSLELDIRSGSEQQLMIDYAVHHRKANGMLTPKVFKWTQRSCTEGEQVLLEKRHSMAPVTTRRYYPGEHRVEILINGQSCAEASFELT
ncbi:MAG: DNA alkylation repair protein [Rhodothermales bacterium]|nr:DNA alkylation repair protein [Rhodothermales bacterium]MBO6781152.1 DNA alkylation repair protein [Rhodothermales bacterium]